MKRHTTFGALLAALALLLAFGLATPAAHAEDMTIELHNATAQSEKDCPVGGAAYWHFVLSPNDGDLAFTSIHLAFTDGTSMTFIGGIIPNGEQMDNVFVAVPAGQTLTTLQTAGSYATYTGSQVANQFNLSHVCEGTVPPTTTTTTTTTTIVEDTTTTTTTTTTSPTTTTEGPTTTLSVLPPTTPAPAATTTTVAAVFGPVPTTVLTTTTIVTALPTTGTTTGTAAIAASLALGAGAVMVLLARRGQRI